jgi:3-phosphoshikimate 1-carboxyvinyltransferase
MSRVRVQPGVVRGRIRAPPSKSYTHRALVIGHLSARRFRVELPLDAEDTRRTADLVTRLGTPVRRGREAWVVDARRAHRPAPVVVDCGESGTTLRFGATLAARGGGTVRFTGRERLGRRPIRGLLDALGALGAHARMGPHGWPLDIGGPIHGGSVRVDASVSSQFVSSLLLVLPTLEEDSRVVLRGPVVSAPYIDATLRAMRAHDVRVARRGRTFVVPGRQRYAGARFPVPGDASSAAYLWAAGAVAGGPVRVDAIPPDWPQADLAVLGLLESAGAEVTRAGSSVTVRRGRPRPFSADLTDAPDLYPLAGAVAAVTPGRSRLRGAPHVVHKESDRRAETARLARALGARVEPSAGGLAIEGTPAPRPLALPDLADHRLMMSAAVAALVCTGPSSLGPAEAVEKSFPRFWEALSGIGAEVAVA